MILSVLVKRDQLEIKFHPEAPLDPQKLVALAEANRKTMRLTPSYQVTAALNVAVGEYDQLFAQIDGILQALATCEKLENRPVHSDGPLAN
jgi:hypothetical protein